MKDRGADVITQTLTEFLDLNKWQSLIFSLRSGFTEDEPTGQAVRRSGFDKNYVGIRPM